jgi:hypothetical protein
MTTIGQDGGRGPANTEKRGGRRRESGRRSAGLPIEREQLAGISLILPFKQFLNTKTFSKSLLLSQKVFYCVYLGLSVILMKKINMCQILKVNLLCCNEVKICPTNISRIPAQS